MNTKTVTRLAAAAVGAATLLGATFAVGQQMAFFRIGTGGTAGTYFPIGGLLSNAVSNPPGSRACADGGACGVPGLIATAVATNGSVANINGIESGALESGLTQSDVAYWAYSGTGVFEGKAKIENLRGIANLYPETIHLVARKGAGIKSPADLKGKRVSLDEPGSGTLIDARIVLSAYGLTEKDVKAEYLKPNASGDRLRDGALDAFFFVGGYPTGAISELATSSGIELVPIAGPEAKKILADFKFFGPDKVPAGTYKDVEGVETVSVNALWVTSAKQPEDLVYGVTKALWNDNSRKLMDAGHAKGKQIRKETALDGIGIPLHPGAEKFYREVGLLK
ncbi:TAXI family TRAP transporter solute-binding subunit [Siculibacillus lacustris]|uniref:TAXI family TRAP transporter solute-binding subunit n=1 Tax=Siculibacillus lacustris TaxID=1549641 RepID=A0A4Q9VUD5_9HYPH|nr:TAXI family TRAP transporter solute-binding subunit [Siculibacillus lacustris]TBW38638.1 TAXI family TRAP transporter solute-binding subunit [Siculibacillus lacustris]